MRMCREIVKRIDMWGIDMVFVVGGNGGNAGAAAIQAQCEKDGVVCNIVGVPKSIDNDILVVSHYSTCHSFIAATCCSKGVRSVACSVPTLPHLSQCIVGEAILGICPWQRACTCFLHPHRLVPRKVNNCCSYAAMRQL